MDWLRSSSRASDANDFGGIVPLMKHPRAAATAEGLAQRRRVP